MEHFYLIVVSTCTLICLGKCDAKILKLLSERFIAHVITGEKGTVSSAVLSSPVPFATELAADIQYSYKYLCMNINVQISIHIRVYICIYKYIYTYKFIYK
jgi:hypothetical protein